MSQTTTRAKVKSQVFDWAQGEMRIFRVHGEKPYQSGYPKD